MAKQAKARRGSIAAGADEESYPASSPNQKMDDRVDPTAAVVGSLMNSLSEEDGTFLGLAALENTVHNKLPDQTLDARRRG